MSRSTIFTKENYKTTQLLQTNQQSECVWEENYRIKSAVIMCKSVKSFGQ